MTDADVAGWLPLGGWQQSPVPCCPRPGKKLDLFPPYKKQQSSDWAPLRPPPQSPQPHAPSPVLFPTAHVAFWLCPALAGFKCSVAACLTRVTPFCFISKAQPPCTISEPTG
jgi:hypothetical protein